MEILCGSVLVVGSTMKRKRSRVSSRPRANPDAMFQSYFCLPSYVEPYGKNEENENQRDTMVASDGSGTENKLKKLKLKMGGVTHTINMKAQIEISSTYGSYVANLSSSSYGLKSQDEAAKNHACSSNKSKGLRDQDQFQKLASTAGFTAENHSCRGKTSGESLTVNHELVCKSKCIPRRLALDVGFSDEENEDAELQFLERLDASKDAVSCNKDSQETRTEHGTFKVSERSQIDGLNNFGTIGSSKDGKKKLKSEKKYEDQGCVEEEGPTSNDKSISEMKKLKKEFVETKNVLSGLEAIIVNISDGFTPTSSQRKKGKLSEMEQQLKKSEAAQRRKMQSEKAAREAEAEAIRKILGQDSGRKKKEEKMKKRQEFVQEKSSNCFSWIKHCSLDYGSLRNSGHFF